MIRLLTVAALLLTAAPPATAAPQDPEKIVEALDAWLKGYQKNRLDLGSPKDLGRDSMARKYDVLPRGLIGAVTARRELELLLAMAAENESPETLQAVLAVAAIGGDDVRYDFRAMPHVARAMGQTALDRFRSPESRATLREIAAEGVRGSKGTGEAMQGAALRALGGFEDGAEDLPLMEAGLRHDDADVRAGAAEGIGRTGAARGLDALAAAIAEEKEPRAMEAMARAARELLRRNPDAPRAPVARAAAGALGETSWRADEELIDLLLEARDVAAVPALIGVLDRFVTDMRAIKKGELSGVLRQRAHEALADLTGAFFAADDPDRWRQWWEQNRATFRVAERKAADAAGEARTEAGFFGIPVHGTRVIFVIDLSLSMEAKMPPLNTSTDDKSKWPTRLDVAREQVWEAAQKLLPDAVFDVVVFSKEARTWQGKLVQASDSNRKKLRKFLDELEPEPYTNLWAGIRAAMEFATGTTAADNQFELDELFVLSDGAPTIGEIQSPPEILRVVTEANRYKRIKIHTVFLQGEVSNMDPVVAAGQMGPAELMEAIAEQNDGRFVKR